MDQRSNRKENVMGDGGVTKRIENAVKAICKGEDHSIDVDGGCIIETAWVGATGACMVRIDLVIKEEAWRES